MTTAKNAVSVGLWLENCYLVCVYVCAKDGGGGGGGNWFSVAGGATFQLVVGGLYNNITIMIIE